MTIERWQQSVGYNDICLLTLHVAHRVGSQSISVTPIGVGRMA
jgi:hypothetical protein